MARDLGRAGRPWDGEETPAKVKLQGFPGAVIPAGAPASLCCFFRSPLSSTEALQLCMSP